MKNRRHFLIQSTLATTAMIALKPLTSIGNTLSQVTGFTGRGRKLAFLHTASVSNSNNVIRYVQNIKFNGRNAILLNAGDSMQERTSSLVYDAAINGSNDPSAITGEYKIITKGNTRTGVICAKTGDNNTIQKIKDLSTYLKTEKNCTLVVCLSQLGFRNENGPDDLTLAKASTDLDIIVGGHSENFHQHPFVALNSNNSEVIIHSAAGNTSECGKIELDVDWQGRKNYITLSDHSSKNITSASVN